MVCPGFWREVDLCGDADASDEAVGWTIWQCATPNDESRMVLIVCGGRRLEQFERAHPIYTRELLALRECERRHPHYLLDTGAPVIWCCDNVQAAAVLRHKLKPHSNAIASYIIELQARLAQVEIRHVKAIEVALADYISRMLPHEAAKEVKAGAWQPLLIPGAVDALEAHVAMLTIKPEPLVTDRMDEPFADVEVCVAADDKGVAKTKSDFPELELKHIDVPTVSYTHLTLPTKA